MINKPLQTIVKSDLETLITEGVREGKTIEYKREAPASTSDDQKTKVLAGISAFANTISGDFLFGIEARDGIPLSLPGIPATEIDSTKQRLEGSMASGINPRITNYSFHEVDVGDGKIVLILRVNRSWTNQHMVEYNSAYRFYGRNNSGKYPLDVSEVRRSILLSEMAPNRARNFREERAQKIATNDTYVRLPNDGKFIVHLVPQQSLSSDFSLDVKRIYRLPNRPSVVGLFPFGHVKVNLDGILFHTKHPEEIENLSYMQWFRNGIVEYVFSRSPEPNGEKLVYGMAFEYDLVKAINSSLEIMSKNGIEFPVYVFVSMVGFQGYTLNWGTIYSGWGSGKTKDDNILVPEIELSDASDIGKEMRPIFDVIWNAFGLEESRNYDADGNHKNQT